MGNSYIEIMFYKTMEVRQKITSDIIKQPDSNFQICDRYLIAHSAAKNSFEIYDIVDIDRITLVKPPVNLDKLGLSFADDVKVNNCNTYFPLVVRDKGVIRSILVDLTQPLEYNFKGDFEVGKSSYYSNFFLSGLELNQKQSNGKNKMIWSSLNTSSRSERFLGKEFEVFEDF